MAPSTAGRRSRPASPAATPAPDRRVAAIDIGSNSIHMIVAESDGAGGFRVLAR